MAENRKVTLLRADAIFILKALSEAKMLCDDASADTWKRYEVSYQLLTVAIKIADTEI